MLPKLVKKMPEWLSDGSPKIKLGLSGDFIPRNIAGERVHSSSFSEILKTSFKFADGNNNNNDDDELSKENVFAPFGKITNIKAELTEWHLFGSRTPFERNLKRRLTNDIKGVFWCICESSERTKRNIETVKTIMGNTECKQIMVLDLSPYSSSKTKPIGDDFKSYLYSAGIEFIEYKDINNALPNMAATLDKKFKAYYPVYLPTSNEFAKYVYQITTV